MADEELFSPSETDSDGRVISARDLGDYGREAVIDSAWDAFDEAETPEEFYRAASVLVFHARHLHPVEHAMLARQLQNPYRRRRGRPANTQALKDAEMAIIFSRFGRQGSAPPRKQIIADLCAQHDLSWEAAATVYHAALRKTRRR